MPAAGPGWSRQSDAVLLLLLTGEAVLLSLVASGVEMDIYH